MAAIHPWAMNHNLPSLRSPHSGIGHYGRVFPNSRRSANLYPWCRSAVAPHVQDFVMPATQLAMPASAVHGQLSTFANGKFQSDTGESVPSDIDTTKLPFFRAQLLKREKAATPSIEPDSEGPSKDAKSEVRANSFETQDTHQTTEPAHGRGRGRKRALATTDDNHYGHLVKVHVHSRSCLVATEALCYCPLPEVVLNQVPMIVTPGDPGRLTSLLGLLKPSIVHAEYDCEDRCRSRGICVHFSLVLGCKKAPDGLICPDCQRAGNEKSYAARRVCVRHNKESLSQFTPNLPEDILATAKQRAAASEILRRALHCDWSGASGDKNSLDVRPSQSPVIKDEMQYADQALPSDSTEIGSFETERPVKMAKIDGSGRASLNSGKENSDTGLAGIEKWTAMVEEDADDEESTPRPAGTSVGGIDATSLNIDESWAPFLPEWLLSQGLDF